MTQLILAFLLSFFSHHPSPTTTVNKGIYANVNTILKDTIDLGGDKGHIPPTSFHP